MKALQLGGFQTGVASARAARLAAAAKRKELITGVTDFPLIDEEIPSVEVVNLPDIVRRAAEASGRAPAARSWFSLKTAAIDKATLADLSRTGRHGAEAEPFWPIRLAEPFERLRDLADQRTAAGRAPKSVPGRAGSAGRAFGAAAMYAQNFFAAGGIGAVSANGDAAALAQAAKSSGCSLACICGSDKRYAEEAIGAARALKEAGVARRLSCRQAGRAREGPARGRRRRIHPCRRRRAGEPRAGACRAWV